MSDAKATETLGGAPDPTAGWNPDALAGPTLAPAPETPPEPADNAIPDYRELRPEGREFVLVRQRSRARQLHQEHYFRGAIYEQNERIEKKLDQVLELLTAPKDTKRK